MRFQGKNILVIGGSSGIGLDLVQLLSKEGANVYAASRSSSDNWPASVRYQPLNVMENMDVLASFLPEELHGLVYSVGSINLKPFSRISENDLIDDFRLNVVGAARTMQLALKSLKNVHSASAVFISSVAARSGMGYHSSIATSKAALEGLAVSLAAELSVNRIRVNVVSPSLTNTPLSTKFLNTPDKMEASAKRHPLGKYGEPGDISAAIAFLLSEDSSWITGQVIAIDGGMGSLRTNI
ncbi:SDR family oxidoreductase [Pedobacter sp. MR2016-19]|uniref:SDR family NAD(P)-dependent oxidoreductase n=1 Tax=Pedobacter sp. MR2016-19 TaxID=2780089 RepID=UPI0018758B35|nr:SDR family oxidoreductase [Pedobacter sp. MR2016-19]MBE5321221.1 SDR family oxidoreductase [Pedobacter sp. MR2016-19]